MKRPTPSQEGKLALFIVMLGLNGTGHFLLALIMAIIGTIWATRDWLNDGYVSNSRLEEARDAAMRKVLPLPSRDNVEWHNWAKKTINEVAPKSDPLPGKGNYATFPYLLDEHDSERMEHLLNIRLWPNPCGCERNETHPWKFNHVPTCPEHPDYYLGIECCCIKKRRKGKTKVYRSLECTVHTTDDERKVAADEAAADDGDERPMAGSEVWHPLGVSPVNGFTRAEYDDGDDGHEVVYPCGCYLVGDGQGDYVAVRTGMCGIEHTNLENQPLFPHPLPDDDDDGMRIK